MQDHNFIHIQFAAMGYIFTVKCNETGTEHRLETSEHLVTVGDLKGVVQDLLGIAPDRQRMIYQGKYIHRHSDGFLLEKYLEKPLGEGYEKIVFVYEWKAVTKPRVSMISRSIG